MAVAKWGTPEAITTAVFSPTGLNSLANAAYTSASAVIDNETDKHLYLNLEVALASLTPTGTLLYVAVYAVYSLDGTTYEDGGGAVAPSNATLLSTFDLSTSAGAKRRIRTNLPIAPLRFTLILENQAGVALAATGNTVRYRRHSGDVT